MRIIDSETHVINPSGIDCCYPMQIKWRWPYIPAPSKNLAAVVAESISQNKFDDISDALIGHMDRYEIDQSVIMRGAFPAKNSELDRIARRHPGRFLVFGSWDLEPVVGDPPHESAAGLEALERGFIDHNCLGAGEFELGRFQPLPPERSYLGFVPTMEICNKHKKPIMFHTGYDGAHAALAYKNPLMLEPLAIDFPDVSIMVAHMGKYDITYFEYAMMLARKCSNIYLTTSNTRTEFITRAVEEIGPERIIFGSDWSMQHGILGIQRGIDVHDRNLRAVREAKIDESEKALILGENLANLLGI